MPELIDKLERDLETNNLDLIRATSHVLKGSMVNVLFPHLKEHTGLLHKKVIVQDWHGAKQQLSHVRITYEPIAKELLAYIGG
jgi:hypothetical protein